MLFADALEAWLKEIGVAITGDSAPPSWQGQVGVATELLPQGEGIPPDTVALLCGPEIMMRFSAYALLNRGVMATDIYL